MDENFKNSLAPGASSRVPSTQDVHVPERDVLLFGSAPDLLLICLQPHSPTPTFSSGGFFISRTLLLAPREDFQKR